MSESTRRVGRARSGLIGILPAASMWGERVWRAFRFEITGLARTGSNTLRIRVANAGPNRRRQGDTVYSLRSWGLRFNAIPWKILDAIPQWTGRPIQHETKTY